MRRLVANLDAEAELGSRTPSKSALKVAAAMGTLLRAFARDDDRLHLAAPLGPERFGDVPGLPRPRLESGPLKDLDPPSAVLAWCETPTVAEHRPHSPRLHRTLDLDLDGPLHEVLWRVPAPTPRIVARVHHRKFHLKRARNSGLALPGATMLESSRALAEHLRAGGADASPTGRFVVKAPLSAAGRSRWIGAVGDLSIPKVRRTVENLFRRHGDLLFEPWMDRRGDFGLAALAGSEGETRIVGVHRQTVDQEGRFTGLVLSEEGLTTDELSTFEKVAGDVGRSLGREGYVGPFGLDAYRYRNAEGKIRFHPLGEINARMTVGLVARGLADRIEARGPVELTVGPKPPCPNALALLHPEPRNGFGLWWVRGAYR